MVATEIETLKHGQRVDYAEKQNCVSVPVSRAAAAKMLGVSERSVNQAAAIKRENPDVAEKQREVRRLSG